MYNLYFQSQEKKNKVEAEYFRSSKPRILSQLSKGYVCRFSGIMQALMWGTKRTAINVQEDKDVVDSVWWLSFKVKVCRT